MADKNSAKEAAKYTLVRQGTAGGVHVKFWQWFFGHFVTFSSMENTTGPQRHVAPARAGRQAITIHFNQFGANKLNAVTVSGPSQGYPKKRNTPDFNELQPSLRTG